jgi:hypothetical protein
LISNEHVQHRSQPRLAAQNSDLAIRRTRCERTLFVKKNLGSHAEAGRTMTKTSSGPTPKTPAERAPIHKAKKAARGAAAAHGTASAKAGAEAPASRRKSSAPKSSLALAGPVRGHTSTFPLRKFRVYGCCLTKAQRISAVFSVMKKK